MSSEQLSVVIVSFNSADTLDACVRSIPGDAQVVLVDQRPGDGSVEVVLDARPDATVVHAGGNRGFGAGCNLGAANASGDVLAFLNPDASFVSDAARLLAGVARRERALVGPALLDQSGQVITRARQWSTAWTDFLDLMLPKRAIPRMWWRDIPGEARVYSEGGRVPYVQGACMVVPAAEFWAVGGFDETFFLYCEEEALAERLLTRGVVSLLEPRAVVQHHGAASTSGVREFSVRQYHRSRAAHLTMRHGLLGGGARVMLLGGGLAVLLATAPVRAAVGYRKVEDRRFCRAGLLGLIDGVLRRTVIPPASGGGSDV